MSSKSSRSLNKRHDNLGLGTPHNRSREREAPNHRKKDRENMGSNMTTSLSCNKIRKIEIQIKISGSGATSIRGPRITLLISTQRRHCWMR
jgi:hypothetical protein